MLRYRLVRGVKSKAIQSKLLSETDLELANIEKVKPKPWKL